MKTIFAIATAASAFAPIAAMAEDPAPFTGPRVGLEGGWARVAGNGHEGSDGFSYGLLMGYDVGSGPLRVGPEIKIADSTQKHCQPHAPGGATARVCQRSDRDLYAGVRIGFVASPKLMIFGAGGYTNGRFSEHFRNLTVGSSPRIDVGRDAGGYRVGGGVEYAISRQLYLSGTYHYSGWKHKDWQHHIHQNQVLAGAGFRF